MSLDMQSREDSCLDDVVGCHFFSWPWETSTWQWPQNLGTTCSGKSVQSETSYCWLGATVVLSSGVQTIVPGSRSSGEWGVKAGGPASSLSEARLGCGSDDSGWPLSASTLCCGSWWCSLLHSSPTSMPRAPRCVYVSTKFGRA